MEQMPAASRTAICSHLGIGIVGEWGTFWSRYQAFLLRNEAAGLTYVNPLNGFSPNVGLATGESWTGMLVQHSSKFAIHWFPATSGRKLGLICLASNFFQLMDLNHLCRLISSLPPCPLLRRLLASFCSSCRK